MGKKTNNKVVSVEDKLKTLYKLQIIDTEVDKIRIIRGELPLEIEDLEDNLAGLNIRLDKFNEELAEIKNDILANKNTVNLATESIKKYEKQLKSIKNNREFSSLTKEIEFQNLEIQLSEKKKVQSDANMLHKKEIIKSCKEQISEKEEELTIKQKKLNKIVKETEKEEALLLKKSVKGEKDIDERLLSSYKRIRAKVVNGLAVVSVERNACGGCFSQIPPQRQLDIQMHKKIIVCEHCGRIMVNSKILDTQKT